MFSRVLQRFQLVHAARYKKAAADLATWQERARKATQQLERARSENDGLRAKVEQLSKTVKGAQRHSEEITARLEKLKAHAQKESDRGQKSDQMLHQLQEKLTTAEHELATARESLMVVEVKLDILEGAANVLDRRTRTAVAARAETTANV